MTTANANRAATAYLKEIDGSNFGTEEGRSVADLAETIDRETGLPGLVFIASAARGVLEHVAHFIRQWDKKPVEKIADSFYGVHAGTEFEADLKRSVLRDAVAVVDIIEAGKIPKIVETHWEIFITESGCDAYQCGHSYDKLDTACWAAVERSKLIGKRHGYKAKTKIEIYRVQTMRVVESLA